MRRRLEFQLTDWVKEGETPIISEKINDNISNMSPNSVKRGLWARAKPLLYSAHDKMVYKWRSVTLGTISLVVLSFSI